MKSKLSLIFAVMFLAASVFCVFPHRTLAAKDTNAISFTSSNTGIEVGSTDDVTFTAILGESGVSGLFVTDENGNNVAQLHETSKGRYEAVVSFTAEERADHTYTLNTQNSDEFRCEMHFYNPLTAQDSARDEKTVQKVRNLSSVLTEGNKAVVLNSMYNTLKSDENISRVWFENEHTLNYQTQDGIMHFYDADYTLKRRTFNLDGVAEANAQPYVEEEPVQTRGTIGNKNIYIVAPDYGFDEDFTLQKLFEARNAVAGMGGGTISAYYGNGNGGEPEIVGKGDVGAFKKLSGYGMVIIDSHGVQVNSSSALVCTLTSGASSADYSAHRLYEGEDELGKFVAVMDTFITYYNNSLPNSLVYIGSCFGVWAANLRNGFSSLGAKLVAGYDWSVSFFWEQRVYGLFMKTLYTANSDGSMNTAQQAFNKVKEIFGDTDSVGEQRAKFKLYGDTSLTLMTSGQVSPTPPPDTGDVTVTLTPDKLTLNIGDSQKLNLTIEPADVADKCEVEWSSFNEEIATVTNTGLVRALDVGKTRIAVEVMTPDNQQISKSAELTVTAGGYTVTFIDGITGKVIDEQIVPEGEAADEPTPPKHEGYVFIGWDKSFDEVTEDMTVTALYAVSGDANLDGKLNTADATVILKYAAQMIQLQSKNQKAADMTGDGKVNTSDATAVLKYCATH